MNTFFLKYYMKRTEYDLKFLLQGESWDTSRDFCLVLRNPSPLFGQLLKIWFNLFSITPRTVCKSTGHTVCK